VNIKRLVKTCGIAVAEQVGPRLPTPALRRLLWSSVGPLMDPAVLPKGLTLRSLKRISVQVPCDPYIYVHRNSFWCGVFYEEEVESYLLREVKPGDTVIDVGMNVGHVTLPAAALGARVFAFEPNPELAALVRKCAEEQGLPVSVFPYALGDEGGSFTLRMEPDHPGGATLRAVGASFERAVQCRVEVGDDVMPPLEGRVLLKIDVEGLEINVLRGLRKTLPRVDHAIIELSPDFVGESGVDDVVALMRESGFAAHALNEDGSMGAKLDRVPSQVNAVFRRMVGGEGFEPPTPSV
jgi:FkbM family methyltransferase